MNYLGIYNWHDTHNQPSLVDTKLPHLFLSGKIAH